MFSIQQTGMVDGECEVILGSQRLHPARPLAKAVFKTGSGRGGNCKEDMRGLASKPQGKGKGTGAEVTMDSSQLRGSPCNIPSK